MRDYFVNVYVRLIYKFGLKMNKSKQQKPKVGFLGQTIPKTEKSPTFIEKQLLERKKNTNTNDTQKPKFIPYTYLKNTYTYLKNFISKKPQQQEQQQPQPPQQPQPQPPQQPNLQQEAGKKRKTHKRKHNKKRIKTTKKR